MTCLAASLVLAAGLVGAQDGPDWSALAGLPPGPARGELVAEALEAAGGELPREAQQLAHDAGIRAADALEFGLALRVQGRLHARVGQLWTGYNLGVTQHRSGQTAAGDATLAALIEGAAPADRANLWSQRGIFALGQGRRDVAASHFGHAMALGSADATAILARERLAGHNLDAARDGFRASLNRNPDHPWALRGWGLTLLSAPQPRDPRDR